MRERQGDLSPCGELCVFWKATSGVANLDSSKYSKGKPNYNNRAKLVMHVGNWAYEIWNSNI
jgi:hypothetical protein